MTWSFSASGHHGSENWESEERELLTRLVDAIEGAPAVVCSGFSFAGNFISAQSLESARELLSLSEEAVEPEEE